MAPAKPRDDEDNRDKDRQPSPPRRTTPAKRSGNNGVATPLNRRNSVGQMPKSAPAAPGTGAVRKSSIRKSNEHSLLGDFFLGRPSPARVAASRRRSADAAAVRAELRQQMRADAVRRVQQPGKVEARVKAWQKANAAAMAQGNPDDAASEPTEVAIHVDVESVTEEDRMRIKSRQKPRRKSSTPRSSPSGKSEDQKDAIWIKKTTAADPKAKEKERPRAISADPRLRGPPKKRIVSDDNWMKRRNINTAQKSAGAGAKPKPGPTPFPKDFLQRTAKTPKMQDKIKEWAKKIEVPQAPEPPKVPRYSPRYARPLREYSTKFGETITVEEAASGVSGPTKSEGALNIITVEEEASCRSGSARTRSGRTVGEDGIRVQATGTSSPRASGDDGIRIRPLQLRKAEPYDDGIRVRPARTSPLPNDGIRIRPGPTRDSAARPASPRRSSMERTRVPSTKRERTPPARIEVIEEPESEVGTPTRKSKSRRSPRMMRGATAPTMTETETTDTGSLSETESWTSDESESRDGTNRPPSAPAKSLADIPFGYSAFSVLDLPVGADHRHTKRPKPTQRTSSFRAVPLAFKKIVTGAKEIVHERVEPPKAATNKPPSIESWLNGTVDPFVDKTVPKTASPEEDQEASARRQPSLDVRQRKEPATTSSPRHSWSDSSGDDDDSQTEIPDQSEGSSPSLKRSKATRSSPSPPKQVPLKPAPLKPTPLKPAPLKPAPLKPAPLKQGAPKKPLRETLNNLFKGESSGHKFPTKAYSAYEDLGPDSEVSYMEDEEEDDRYNPRRRSMGTRARSPSPESSYVSTEVSSITGGPYMTPAIPRRQPPPTSGEHELSTIASERSESTLGSDTLSTISESTVTQTTELTRSTALSRRSKGSGLKRRLTKHSDLVSVLSLPDDADNLSRSKSIRSTSSLRRRTSKLGRVTVDDLLREFAVDEDFYQRELKTLVDGAVPVLLNQVVQGNRDYAIDLFGPSTDGRTDIAGKTVVNMGIALDKLRNLHKRAPLYDVNKVLNWLLTAFPIYNRYLDVWRLGFEGIVVNLARGRGRADDEDSLVNAMPRNEDGDVVDTKGQPVDLQRLLTRPLVRIKGLLKLLRGAQAIGNKHPELDLAIEDFTALQAKARRRHREEVARKTDEDAITTDTRRCCDLRTLNAMERVLIDPSRQVNAKDFFSLDLSHSSGQRVECQVELIYRDKPKDSHDKGDILIRDVGHSRCCLLFPPIPKSAMSARKADGALVCMIRGRHNGKEWYETFTLSANLEDQILDWLNILGTSPVPPSTTRRHVSSSASSTKSSVDMPLGERTGSSKSRKSQPPQLSPSSTASETMGLPKPSTPSRYQTRHASSPATPTTPTTPTSSHSRSPSPETTPTQKGHRETGRPRSLPVLPPKAETTPLHEDMRPDPRDLAKSSSDRSHRKEGPPPIPVHRTFSSKKSSSLSPPVDLNSPRVQRRGSSPLKHEFRPSDVSSSSSETDSDSASDVESSSDELDEADVPDTQPAISIRQAPEISGVESTVSDSVAPSQSASQVGLFGRLGPGGAKDPEYIIKSIASISYWSDKKGQWNEALKGACSIVITPGLIEAYPLATHSTSMPYALNSSGTSETGDVDPRRSQPLIALELTPIVMIRQSTALDLEVRSPVRPYCKLSTIDGKIFRFRAPSAAEGTTLYTAVHKARLNNAKYKALEEESRFRSFGQAQTAEQIPESQASSGRRRGWFGRKNSYRASTRAPSHSASQSQGATSSISARSLLKRLTGAADLPFNIHNSSIDRHRRSASGIGGIASMFASESSSAGGMTPPRSPSLSLASGRTQVLGSDNLKIRCHLLVTPTKWEDYGNCNLHITRPPPGMRQELRIRHGMEKRVIVTKVPKKSFPFVTSDPEKETPVTILDVVLGSKCFGRLGSRGIILNVWEEVRDENNNVGLAPAKGGLSGKVTKWCFQCSSATEASWIFGLVAQEVEVGLA